MGLRELMEQQGQKVTEDHLVHLDHLDLLENFPSFHLISCSKEMLLPDPREKPEEMQSMKDPDLRRTVMST